MVSYRSKQIGGHSTHGSVGRLLLSFAHAMGALVSDLMVDEGHRMVGRPQVNLVVAR